MSELNRPFSFHVDDVDSVDGDLLVEVLNAQDAVAGVVRLREWTRAALAVRPGETVLDMGSGTGTELLALAAQTGPTGMAIGVDPNPMMLRVAGDRADQPAARWINATAYAVPLADGCVDAARCERVYQHLNDPARATAELARVLRPGGRVVLVDSDWDTAVTYPGDPAILAALAPLREAMGPNRNSGRRLRGLLVQAGLVVDDIGSQALLWDPDAVRPIQQRMAELGVETGLITVEERDRLSAEFESGVAAGDYHFSVTMFAVSAHKPRPDD